MHRFVLFTALALLLPACGGFAILPLLPQEGEENAACLSDLECDAGLICGPCADGDCCIRSDGPCSPLFPNGDCPIGQRCDDGLCLVGDTTWCDCDPTQGCDPTDGSCHIVDATNRCSPTNPTGLCVGTDVCNGGQCVPCTDQNTCSETRTDGCCPPGGICVAGRCLNDIGDNSCSPQNTSGECELPGQICSDQGICEDAACAPDFPFGNCPTGQVCQGGTCDCIPCGIGHLDGCCPAGDCCSTAGRCMEDTPNHCLADGDCFTGTYCASDEQCRADGTCVEDIDCAADESCEGGICTRDCTLDTDCDTGFHCDIGNGNCIVDTCSSLGCTGLNRLCDDTGPYALCTACATGYHEAAPVVDSCEPDTCLDIDCAAQNRDCDQSGAFAVCGDCLGGFTEDGSGICRECSLTAECTAGFHCTPAGACNQECTIATQATDCEDGRVCSPHGRCVAEGPDPNLCAAATDEGQIVEPYVMLLVDQSGSMTSAYDTGNRWDDLYDVLFNTTDGVVWTMQGLIQFGLTLYTGSSGTCPDLTQVDPALDNYAAMETVYDNNSPTSDTPTGDSIDALVTFLNGLPDDREKFILLATDGEPDRCEELNPQRGHAESVVAAANAFAQGIRLFMLSVGADVRDDHMQDVANAGGGCTVDPFYNDAPTCTPITGACYDKQNDVTDYSDYNPQVVQCPLDPLGQPVLEPFYKATNKAQLISDLNTILGSTLGCVVRLAVTPGCPPVGGAVYVDGDAVVEGGSDGWVVTGPDTIELLGASCTNVQDGAAHFIAAQFDTCDCPE